MKPTIPGHEDVERMEQALFESLRRDEPPAGARRATAAALGLGVAALTSGTAGAQAGAAVAPSIAPTLAKVGPLLLVKWVGIGTVAAAVSVGAIHYASVLLRANPPKPVAAMMPPPRADGTSLRLIAPPSADVPLAPPERGRNDDGTPAFEPQRGHASIPGVPRQTAQVPPSFASRETEMAERSSESPARLATPPDRARPVDQPAIESTAEPSGGALVRSRRLAGEVAMLDQAWSAVVARDGERTLDLLGRYAREFPGAMLNHEATVLRIEALFLTGSAEAATSLGREFLAAYPNSTHSSRVRRLLAERPKP